MTRIICLLLPLIISSCAIPIKPHSEPASYALKPSVKSSAWEDFNDNFPDDNQHSSWSSADEILTQQPAGNIGQRIMDFIFGLFPIDSEM